MNTKVLFILKRKNGYNPVKDSHIGLTTGLYNSASFMNDMLNELGIESHISVVHDNNDIDREVTKHKPTHVIIEALWVVPTKFHVLCNLHPRVNWIIRLHSETPFLSNEGVAIDWICEYVLYENVTIATNGTRIREELRNIIKTKTDWSNKEIKKKIIYLPNFYPQEYKVKEYNKDKEYIDISCFGAVRPMKNHLIQAIASIKFAKFIGKKLRFHINSGRIEQKGESVLKNLLNMFEHLSDSGHELINHEWTHRENFLKICSEMDIGLQVSFSETFNIVSADLLSQGVPVVTSDEIPWVNPWFTAKPTKSNHIFFKLLLTHYFPKLNTYTNKWLLTSYTNKTKKIWLKYFKNEK